MSLFSKGKKSDEANLKEGKPSLAVAVTAQRFGKKKKMAVGGEVIGPDPAPRKPDNKRPPEAEYMADHFAEGGEVEEHMDGIVDAIMRKRKMAEGGMVDLNANSEEEPNQYDEMNADAANAEQFDDDQISPQPTDSNERGDEIESDMHDLVSQIRAKLKAKQGS